MTNFAFAAPIAKKFAGPRASVGIFEIAGAAMALAVGLLGTSLVAPAPTEGNTYVMAQLDPVQMTRDAPRDLPSIDGFYLLEHCAVGRVDTVMRAAIMKRLELPFEHNPCLRPCLSCEQP